MNPYLAVHVILALLALGPGCRRPTPGVEAPADLLPFVPTALHGQVSPCPPHKPHGQWWFRRVLIVVLENQNYRDVMEDSYFSELSAKGALFTQSHGVCHPSYSNYLALITGRRIITEWDQQRDFNATLNIGVRLKQAGLNWKNYAEDFPGCGTLGDSGRYVRRHVPFMSFVSDREVCTNIVSEMAFDADLRNGTLPDFALYSPNLDDDGHDPRDDPKKGLQKASAWLQTFIDKLERNSSFLHKDRGLLIVTFDESRTDDRDFRANHIYTLFLGDPVARIVSDDPITHFNVLRTVEDNFGLTPLAKFDRCARPILNVWKGEPGSGR